MAVKDGSAELRYPASAVAAMVVALRRESVSAHSLVACLLLAPGIVSAILAAATLLRKSRVRYALV